MRLPRILPILATSLLLVSCGSDTDDGGAPGSAPEGAKAADTRSGATPDADDGDRAVSEDPADFSDLTEAESFMFTANSGTRAGTSFTTPNGNIACHIVVERAACVVMEHGGWPTEGRAQDGLSEYEPDTIGWRTQVGGKRAGDLADPGRVAHTRRHHPGQQLIPGRSPQFRR